MIRLLCSILLLCSACLAGCEQGASAPPSNVETLRDLHSNPLTRTACVGCPASWTMSSCTFLEELMRQGSGASAAMCSVVSSRGGTRGLPDQVQVIAKQRIAEAREKAEGSPEEALLLFGFGEDLLRLAEPELWVLGLEAQATAIDALERAPPDDAWPSALLRLAENSLPPVRITDMVLVDGLSQRGHWTEDRLRTYERGSALALAAIRSAPAEREAAVAAFAAVIPGPYDLVLVWRRGEALRLRSVEVALKGALGAWSAGRRSCPPDLAALSPRYLDHVPSGWKLERAPCAVRHD